jgi:hypothetical protein
VHVRTQAHTHARTHCTHARDTRTSARTYVSSYVSTPHECTHARTHARTRARTHAPHARTPNAHVFSACQIQVRNGVDCMTIQTIVWKPRRLGSGSIDYRVNRGKWSSSDLAFDKHLVSKAWHRRIKAIRLGFVPVKFVAWLPSSATSLYTISARHHLTSVLRCERSIRKFVLREISADPSSLFIRWITARLRRLHLVTTNATTVVL